MNLQTRINLLAGLGTYLKNNPEDWQEVKKKASIKNAWFAENFIDLACENIADHLLDKEKLEAWVSHYHIDDNISPKTVGIVMAGNIPLVGFHDFVCVFISGHHQKIKLSSKDDLLLPFLLSKMKSENAEFSSYVQVADMLKDCDAYIATGSNNTSRYFEQYFGKYPHIIRKNRTSVAILSGEETDAELLALSDDIHLYFGLGCRNVSKIYVPQGYDFIPLLKTFEKYAWFREHNKYRNNFDYQLSVLLINNIYYMTDGTTLLTENKQLFSPIAQVFFEYYQPGTSLPDLLPSSEDVQCTIGKNALSFGKAQQPGLYDYADGVDVMAFLLSI